MLVFPVSNAKVERGFSTMKRVKTDWRCSLGETVLDTIMRISIEGPELSKFDPQKAVESYFSTPRRPKRKEAEMEKN